MSTKNSPGVVESVNNGSDVKTGQIVLQATRSLVTLFVHIVVGVIVSVALLFGFRNGTPTNATSTHVMICVIGYQLLMVEAILALAPDSWLSSLKLQHRRLTHLFMQVLGSVFALGGSYIKILDKDNHWVSLHGQFALAAMVFTTVSLVNGLTSFYAYELRQVLPGTLSKLSHICFGVGAILSANISLMYGFNKTVFSTWAPSLSETFIILTSMLTVIIIINPLITFIQKFLGVFKK